MRRALGAAAVAAILLALAGLWTLRGRRPAAIPAPTPPQSAGRPADERPAKATPPPRRASTATRPTRSARTPAAAPTAPAAAPPAARESPAGPAAAASASAASPPAEGEPELAGAIEGSVSDATGKPFARARVLGIAADGMDAGETLTGEDGSFRIAPLRPGRYTVFSGLGTSLVTRLGARGVSVEPGAMSRLDVLEPRSGSAVHVSVLGADGRPIDAQALLVAGPPRESGSFDSVLASDAVYLPDPGEVRIVLPRVPPGTYTLILLRNVEQPPVAARDPVRVSGADMHLTVRLGAGLPGP